MVRFAIVGSNFITDWFMNGARLCEGFALEAVYSRSMERARERADALSAPKAYDDLAALAADDSVDAVYIASPNALHERQSELFLRGGRHVLCEKPIATNAAAFKRLAGIAARRGLIFMEAMRPAHAPALDTIRAAMQKIGKIRHASFTFCQYSSRYDKFKQGIIENAFRPELKNGALMDIGVYCVHMCVMLLGEPDKIHAQGRFLPDSIDAAGTITAVYRDMTAQITYSKVYDSHLPCEIAGEGGSVLFSPLTTPRSIELRLRGCAPQTLAFETREHDMSYEISSFIEQIKAGRADAVWGEYSASALRVMDAARTQIGIDFTSAQARQAAE